MKKNDFVIPTTFECGFRTNNVWYDPQQIYSDRSPVGLNNLGTGDVYMQSPVVDKVDEQAIYEAFNHELVHSILYSMGEGELCHSERFVDGFAHLLTQFELTKKGDLLDRWKSDYRWN
jgi:predicted SprT family Zn-dependent metalloprotease